jgi:hypothetical protein
MNKKKSDNTDTSDVVWKYQDPTLADDYGTPIIPEAEPGVDLLKESNSKEQKRK